ncbi:MAG: tetratricopeptide repeat protein [Candidatus Coatesbacteria bacterium]|nr:tetratricopeptide repeat protein [Candidatus Coatesbacteria bacterium]
MKCYNCGTELRGDAKFCDECGEKQGPSRRSLLSEEEISEIRARTEPDVYISKLRKVVREGFGIEWRRTAVLFVDVSGFTPMSYALSPDQLRQVMKDVYAIMSEAVAKCGGYVDKFFGDEVMALFGAPIALERPCDQAIAAAGEIAIGLAGVNHRFKDILPVSVSIHAGIAFGKVQAGRLGDSSKLEFAVLGETVNVAKRLTDAAPPGNVFVSKRIEDRTGDRFAFESLGTQQFQGLKQPMEVFRLIGPRGAGESRPRFSQARSPMYGRHHELSGLIQTSERIMTRYPDPEPSQIGEGKYREYSRVFGISGEAGIGKSRLIREFREHLCTCLGESGFRWLSGSGWSIGQTPLYWPIRMQLASALGFDVNAPSEITAASLSNLGGDESENRELVPYLYHLYGISYEDSPLSKLAPKTVRDNLWIAIRRLYARWASEKPLVLVFEDMHWADSGTEKFLDYLAGFVADLPIVILVTHRPQFKLGLARRGDVPFSEFVLGPLSANAERQLLDYYIRPGVREHALIRRLRKFSEGNPLFVEEFLHLLLEEGKLTVSDGKMHLTQNIEQMPLPAGISGVLVQRIDRLELRDKRVAYYAAVIGRSFPSSLLKDIYKSLHEVDEVDEALDVLERREILLRKAAEPEPEYVFKHALTREMLVSRLLEGLRRELSRLVAIRVEKLYPDRIAAFHGVLSEHWEAAGEIEKAARHAAFWGIYNRQQQFNFEANTAFEKYSSLSQKLSASPLSPEDEADVVNKRIRVLTVLGSYEHAISLCRLLHDLCDGAHKASALSREAYLRLLMGDLAASLLLGEEALAEGKRQRNLEAQAGALNILGIVHANRGGFDRALKCMEESLHIRRELGDRQGIGTTLNDISILYRRRGDHDRALEYGQQSLSMSRQMGDRHGIATSLNTIGLRHTFCGDYEAARQCYEESLAAMREIGHRDGIATCLINVGLVFHLRGRYDEAIEHYTKSLEIVRDLGDRASVVLCLSNIGAVQADKGAFQEAMRAATEAESIARSIDDKPDMIRSLATLCRAHAGLGGFTDALRCGAEAVRTSEAIEHQEGMFLARYAMAEAHLHIARWHDMKVEKVELPLPREEALRESEEFAGEAVKLAESKGMGGYLARAKRLLAELATLRGD